MQSIFSAGWVFCVFPSNTLGISYVVRGALILDKTIKDMLIHYYYYLLVRAERNLSFIKAKSQRSVGTLALLVCRKRKRKRMKCLKRFVAHNCTF